MTAKKNVVVKTRDVLGCVDITLKVYLKNDQTEKIVQETHNFRVYNEIPITISNPVLSDYGQEKEIVIAGAYRLNIVKKEFHNLSKNDVISRDYHGKTIVKSTYSNNNDNSFNETDSTYRTSDNMLNLTLLDKKTNLTYKYNATIPVFEFSNKESVVNITDSVRSVQLHSNENSTTLTTVSKYLPRFGSSVSRKNFGSNDLICINIDKDAYSSSAMSMDIDASKHNAKILVILQPYVNLKNMKVLDPKAIVKILDIKKTFTGNSDSPAEKDPTISNNLVESNKNLLENGLDIASSVIEVGTDNIWNNVGNFHAWWLGIPEGPCRDEIRNAYKDILGKDINDMLITAPIYGGLFKALKLTKPLFVKAGNAVFKAMGKYVMKPILMPIGKTTYKIINPVLEPFLCSKAGQIVVNTAQNTAKVTLNAAKKFIHFARTYPLENIPLKLGKKIHTRVKKMYERFGEFLRDMNIEDPFLKYGSYSSTSKFDRPCGALFAPNDVLRRILFPRVMRFVSPYIKQSYFVGYNLKALRTYLIDMAKNNGFSKEEIECMLDWIRTGVNSVRENLINMIRNYSESPLRHKGIEDHFRMNIKVLSFISKYIEEFKMELIKRNDLKIARDIFFNEEYFSKLAKMIGYGENFQTDVINLLKKSRDLLGEKAYIKSSVLYPKNFDKISNKIIENNFIAKKIPYGRWTTEKVELAQSILSAEGDIVKIAEAVSLSEKTIYQAINSGLLEFPKSWLESDILELAKVCGYSEEFINCLKETSKYGWNVVSSIISMSEPGDLRYDAAYFILNKSPYGPITAKNLLEIQRKLSSGCQIDDIVKEFKISRRVLVSALKHEQLEHRKWATDELTQLANICKYSEAIQKRIKTWSGFHPEECQRMLLNNANLSDEDIMALKFIVRKSPYGFWDPKTIMKAQKYIQQNMALNDIAKKLKVNISHVIDAIDSGLLENRPKINGRRVYEFSPKPGVKVKTIKTPVNEPSKPVIEKTIPIKKGRYTISEENSTTSTPEEYSEILSELRNICEKTENNCKQSLKTLENIFPISSEEWKKQASAVLKEICKYERNIESCINTICQSNNKENYRDVLCTLCDIFARFKKLEIKNKKMIAQFDLVNVYD